MENNCILIYLEASRQLYKFSKSFEIISSQSNLSAYYIVIVVSAEVAAIPEELLCPFNGYSVPITYSMLIKPIIGRNFKIFAWHLV